MKLGQKQWAHLEKLRAPKPHTEWGKLSNCSGCSSPSNRHRIHLPSKWAVPGLYHLGTGCHPNPRLEDNSISPTSSHVHCHSGHRKQVRNTSPQHNCCWGQGQIILSVGGGKSLSYCRASRAEDHEHKHYEEKQQTNCAKDTDVSGK